MSAAGRLRHIILLQQRARVNDGMGGNSNQIWQDVASLWAQVKPLRGSEDFETQQLKSVQLYEVILRWRSDVTPSHRLVFDNLPLNIISIENKDMHRRFINLLCESGVQQ